MLRGLGWVSTIADWVGDGLHFRHALALILGHEALERFDAGRLGGHVAVRGDSLGDPMGLSHESRVGGCVVQVGFSAGFLGFYGLVWLASLLFPICLQPEKVAELAPLLFGFGAVGALSGNLDERSRVTFDLILVAGQERAKFQEGCGG